MMRNAREAQMHLQPVNKNRRESLRELQAVYSSDAGLPEGPGEYTLDVGNEGNLVLLKGCPITIVARILAKLLSAFDEDDWANCTCQDSTTLKSPNRTYA